MVRNDPNKGGIFYGVKEADNWRGLFTGWDALSDAYDHFVSLKRTEGVACC
jgi:hypothetical protein